MVRSESWTLDQFFSIVIKSNSYPYLFTMRWANDQVKKVHKAWGANQRHSKLKMRVIKPRWAR